MIRTEIVPSGTLSRAAGIADKLSRLEDSRHPCTVGVSFNGSRPPATVGINAALLSKLTKLFDESATISMVINEDGSTTIEAGKARYVLRPTAPLNDVGAMRYVVPFEQLLSLARSRGRVDDIARKLARELGADVPEKERRPSRPSKVEVLAERERMLCEKIANLEAELAKAERAERIDTSPLERAEKMYEAYATRLHDAARLMGWCPYPPRSGSYYWDVSKELKERKQRDANNRAEALAILEGLTPPLPARLMDRARAVFEIPVSHNNKRMEATWKWFIAARTWIARAMGGRAFAICFDAKPPSIAKCRDSLPDVGTFYPDETGKRRRLVVLEHARANAAVADRLREELLAARCNLSVIRGLLDVETFRDCSCQAA